MMALHRLCCALDSAAAPRKIVLVGPAQQCGADGEACANLTEQHQTSLLQLPFLDRGTHCQGNRSSSGIAVAVNVDDHLVRTWPGRLGGAFKEGKVGLLGMD